MMTTNTVMPPTRGDEHESREEGEFVMCEIECIESDGEVE